jgi:hypothetical protein
MTRDELALANMKFLKECIDGEHSNDFDVEDMLNIARSAKSLSYSRSIRNRIETFCKTLDKYKEQKRLNAMFDPVTASSIVEDEVRSIVEELMSNVFHL